MFFRNKAVKLNETLQKLSVLTGYFFGIDHMHTFWFIPFLTNKKSKSFYTEGSQGATP